MKPKHQRLLFVLFCVVCLSASALVAMQALRENVVFFYAPSELAGKPVGQRVRIGGLVEEGSMSHDGQRVRFRITDDAQAVDVEYSGLLPSLFREGQGVVAEGIYAGGERFTATRILAKHDERYMPPEVAEKLKETGRWKGQ